MKPVVVHITEDGTIRFLVGEGMESFLTNDNAIVRRASHVEPVSPFFRAVYHALRFVFGEKGRMADFTRLWPCLWRINLAPIGGPILPQTYAVRADAIDAEIEELNENFI